jgi:hypothetical protein
VCGNAFRLRNAIGVREHFLDCGNAIDAWERFESVGMLLVCGTSFVHGNAFTVWECF